MDVFRARLDQREEDSGHAIEADLRWMRERGGIDPAERLTRWDAWLLATLARSLTWPADEARRAKLMRQCAAEITIMVRQLRGRGWLLDGDALAQHVQACLKPIGEYQRAGKVGDFWPYFRAAVRRYVGANAEELQAHARRTGGDESTQSMSALLTGLGLGGAIAPKGPSLTELISARDGEIREAATLREKQAAARRQKRACSADAEPLLDGFGGAD